MYAMTPAVIFGSSRRFGNTRQVIDELFVHANIPLFDLSDFNMSPFDYEQNNRNDDFIPLIKQLMYYDAWVIATPVYWYSMSTQHKIFFDRFADLLKGEKDLGRQLRGKKMFVVASFGTSYPEGFEILFQQMCDYLGMEYLGTSFIYKGDEENENFIINNKVHAEKARLTLGISSKT